MPELLLILLLVILVAGFILIFVKLGKRPSAPEDSEVELLRTQNEELKTAVRVADERQRMQVEQIEKLTGQVAERDSGLLAIHSQLSARNAEYNSLLEKLREQKADLENLQERFRNEFRNLANEILEEKSKRFTEQNRTKLEELLKPLGEKIRDFEKKVEETYDRESKQRFSLEKEIRNLAELNSQISKEANNLTNALKGQAKTQGNWGEIVLETILEKSGLTRDREFFIQPSFVNETGKRLQPDVVIVYPGERHVVIDSKVSLVAYERYAAAEQPEEQETYVKEHLLSVRTHINELSGKNYQDIYTLKSLDFVMLFMPIEPAYLLAMQSDPNLWNYAYERRILLISPTNLIAALRMIANLWRVEYQNKNVQEIARQSGELYDKFVGFLEDLQDIGNKLDATHKAFDASMNKLSSGKGNLIRRVENIRSLGSKTSKEIPRSLLEKADDS